MKSRVAMVAVVLLFVLLFQPAVHGQEKVVYVAKVDGMITGYTVDQFDRYISEAERNNAEAIIIELNTPGGRGDAMQAIVTRIQNARVPVIIYVYPSGGMAASAGTYIALSSHLIAMSPGTVIGACRPILGYGQNGSIVEAPPKITNFYIAYLRELARMSGRNETLAEEFITQDRSVTPEEALKYGVIEIIATNVNELLQKADGMETKIPVEGKGRVTLHLKDAEVVYIEPSFRDTVVKYITDPTIAYLLLNLGFIGLIFGFLTPGWHVPETIGAIMLVLGLIGLGYFGYKSAGLVLIVLAMIFFIAEALTPTFGLFTVAGVATFIIGGIMLFSGAGGEYLVTGETYTLLRIAIIATAVLLGLFFLFGMAAVVRAQKKKPKSGREELVGAVGKVVEELDPEGVIKVRGELWKAVSRNGARVAVGEEVRVVEVRGLALIVEKIGERRED
ncbi:NfeD family protein [Thermococcus thioreducens]|uniref:Membrane-bound serine protease (ClpP class) n=1 Tax=Thermococcus thioreducens TaxID=277988 RepID=A0A0Q2MQX8_9EURY|nr:nodulation protein NfeD [Thermococcus thioreducens]ASJ12905.1 nodulation protein NfeD [Thermococcus thioreducens]KQH82095.1 nodulation protein NfeD [Thermococcus thioreducens]SEV83599.1 membrane-bound serine protease (ClpP class) [Thermococcus thioreducens]